MNGFHVLVLMAALALIFWGIHHDGYAAGREHGRTEERKRAQEAAKQFYDWSQTGV